MTDRDTERLVGVHPALVEAINDVLTELEDEHIRMFVVEGVRSTDRQQALFAQGRTVPGLVVTYKDGIIHRSNHQPRADGYGYAVDCAFVDAQPFDQHHPWERYGDALEAQGVRWGGRWSMQDLPHAEWPMLPKGERLA